MARLSSNKKTGLRWILNTKTAKAIQTIVCTFPSNPSKCKRWYDVIGLQSLLLDMWRDESDELSERLSGCEFSQKLGIGFFYEAVALLKKASFPRFGHECELAARTMERFHHKLPDYPLNKAAEGTPPAAVEGRQYRYL